MELKELLGEELFNQVSDKLGDKKLMIDDKNFIPKSRFDEVNEAKKDLEKQISDRDKQLKDLSTKAQGNEELSKQIEQLQLSNKQIAKDYEDKITKMQFDNTLDKSLSSAKVKDTKLIKALLDMDNIKYQEGNLEGLDSQIEAIKTSHSYLFDIESTPPSTGGIGNFGRQGKQIINPWKKETFNLTEQAKILKENPALAEQLKNEK